MSESVALEVPSQQSLVDPAQRILDDAGALVIDSPAMLDFAASELKAIKAKANALEEQRKVITKPLDEAKSRVMDLFRGPLDLLGQAEAKLKRGILTYNEAERKKRDEAQRLADEAARKERQRLEEQARRERERADAEAAALRQRAAEAEAAGKAAEAARLAARADAKVETATANADALQAAAQAMPTSVVIPAAPKAAGTSTAVLYSAEISDMVAFAAFVAANPMYAACLKADPTVLNGHARALRDAFAFPGCKLVKTETLRSRAA